MTKKLWEMDPQEMVDFAKSNEIGELGQVELLKSLITTGQSTVDAKGRDQRDIQDEEGVGKMPVDNRDARAMSGRYQGEKKVGKGSETVNDDADIKNAEDEDDDGVDNEEEERNAQEDPEAEEDVHSRTVQQSRSKSKKSYAQAIERHEDQFIADMFAKSRDANEMGDLIDSTPFLRTMTDTIATTMAKSQVAVSELESMLEKSLAATAEVTKLVKSQSARIKNLEAAVAETVEIAKSRSRSGESEEEDDSRIEKSNAQNVAQGAMAVLGKGAQQKVAKGGTAKIPLTGEYKRDSLRVMQVIEKAANEGKPGAIKMLNRFNATPANELPELVGSIPTDWE